MLNRNNRKNNINYIVLMQLKIVYLQTNVCLKTYIMSIGIKK